MSYSHELKKYLGEYKGKRMPGLPNGAWRSNWYPHILPSAEYKQNILAPLRNEFWNWFGKQQPEIKRHQDFPHLNSSQAMCFNLFYPFIADGYALMPILQGILRLPGKRIEAVFEKVFTDGFYTGENTNFDFYLESGGGPIAFFELKLSESEFGTATKRKEDTVEDYRSKYTNKREKYHRESLTHLVDEEWLEFDAFTKNYQLLRNISYLGRNAQAQLFVIFPKANKSLLRGEMILRKIIALKLSERVTIYHLEDLLDAILASSAMTNPKTAEHFREFKVKYMC